MAVHHAFPGKFPQHANLFAVFVLIHCSLLKQKSQPVVWLA